MARKRSNTKTSRAKKATTAKATPAVAAEAEVPTTVEPEVQEVVAESPAQETPTVTAPETEAPVVDEPKKEKDYKYAVKTPDFPDLVPEDYEHAMAKNCNFPQDSFQIVYHLRQTAQLLKSNIHTVPARYFVVKRALEIMLKYLEYNVKLSAEGKGIKIDL